MKTIFNPEYLLKLESNKTLLMPYSSYWHSETIVDHTIVLHPIQALILCAFDGREYGVVLNELSDILSVDKEELNSFVKKNILANTSAEVLRNSKLNIDYIFPKNTLINVSDEFEVPVRKHTIENLLENYEFTIPFESKQQRHETPTDILFVINTKCYTDCIYCYANKQPVRDCSVPFETLNRTIDELHKLGGRSFDITGGEWINYKHWDKLLKKIFSKNLSTFLSTKVPLSEQEVSLFKKIGGKNLQISLDTLIPDNLSNQLAVDPQYKLKIENTLKLLEKYDITVWIHTIITNINNSKADLESIFEFIKNMNNIEKWRIDPASPSLYKTNKQNSDFVINNYPEDLLFYMNELQKLSLRIEFTGELDDIVNPVDSTDDFIRNKSICTGNYSSLVILPDGNVTICEELYWHPEFFIGNIKNQSLVEIWNSSKAKKLYYTKQLEFNKKSACYSCSEFEKCRIPKQVCYREIVRKYGSQNWDYADPRCPKASMQKV